MVARLLCLIIGYAFGCFLTADAVSRRKLGESALNVGSRNPGMANIGSLLGTRWAAVVLTGDILKTVAACEICRWVIAPDMGQLAVLCSGLGVVIGHNYPAWTGFRGGKGVTVTCSVIVLFDPIWGGLACVVGLLVVLFAHYLCLGAVAISLSFCLFIGLTSGIGEAFWLSVAIAVLMLIAHGGPCWRALHHEEPMTFLFKKKKMF